MTAALPTPVTSASSVAGKNPIFAQCMLRIANPTRSHQFYTNLGMKLLTRIDFPDFKFSLFFYAYSHCTPPPHSDPQPHRAKWLWSRPEPTIELTWNWPADTYDESVQRAEEGDCDEVYVNGNVVPMGFGHLGIVVDNVSAAVAALKGKGVTVVRQVETVGDKHVAVVSDPDSYHVQITGKASAPPSSPPSNFASLNPLFSTVMLRVKDPRTAIPFFERLGFRNITRVDDHAASTTKYYMAYTTKATLADSEALQARSDHVLTMRECKLELVHVWGSEAEEEQMYANGNVKPYRGFGHIGVIVDDIYSTMSALEAEGYQVVRKPSPFANVGEIAFIAEPSTSYWVEIIKREGAAPDMPYMQP